MKKRRMRLLASFAIEKITSGDYGIQVPASGSSHSPKDSSKIELVVITQKTCVVGFSYSSFMIDNQFIFNMQS